MKPLSKFAVAIILAGMAGGPMLPAAAQEFAQQKREAPKNALPGPASRAKVQPPPDDAQAIEKPPEPPTVGGTVPAEKVEADVSTRQIAITSAYTGTQIVVFGSVDNSRQPSAESGYYDVVVIVEGAPTPLVAHKKSNVGGLWVNTASARFQRAPSFYAIAATRPIEEIADPAALENNNIGFEFVRLVPTPATASTISAQDLREHRDAVVRIKREEGLYVRKEHGVAFIGRSLFRATVELPANVPVGTLAARVYLFQGGRLLSRFSTRVDLERQGLEAFLFDFAGRSPFLYGLFSVALALTAGLAASALFRRRMS